MDPLYQYKNLDLWVERDSAGKYVIRGKSDEGEVRDAPTVDLATREATVAKYERSDVCAVPAAAVVGEAVVAWELANAFLEKFGGDAVADVEKAVEAYAARIR